MKEAIKQPKTVEKPEDLQDDVKSQLPEPQGYKILVVMPQADEKQRVALLRLVKLLEMKKLVISVDMY